MLSDVVPVSFFFHKIRTTNMIESTTDKTTNVKSMIALIGNFFFFFLPDEEWPPTSVELDSVVTTGVMTEEVVGTEVGSLVGTFVGLEVGSDVV